eukprot:8145484-Pyramimonas_sp.AAC.2
MLPRESAVFAHFLGRRATRDSLLGFSLPSDADGLLAEVKRELESAKEELDQQQAEVKKLEAQVWELTSANREATKEVRDRRRRRTSTHRDRELGDRYPSPQSGRAASGAFVGTRAARPPGTVGPIT